VRERFEVTVHAPADVVFDTAMNFNLQSIPLVNAIFWLRAKVLRVPHIRMAKGIVEETTALGWGRLAYTSGRELVMGAVTQPWFGEVKFRAVPPESFVDFNEPDMVKIAWTFEAESIDTEHTRLRTQTRVIATDDNARRKFRAYWRKFGIGILMIRWLALPAIRRQAERRYRNAMA
jgi:hypothetical protein